jgi:hypothetical protein
MPRVIDQIGWAYDDGYKNGVAAERERCVILHHPFPCQLGVLPKVQPYTNPDHHAREAYRVENTGTSRQSSCVVIGTAPSASLTLPDRGGNLATDFPAQVPMLRIPVI